mgnify:CR=1 FL=1
MAGQFAITGTWRTLRPVRDEVQCTQCLICWIMCPDAAIPVENGKVKGVQLAIAEDAENVDHLVDPEHAIRMAMARQ